MEDETPKVWSVTFPGLERQFQVRDLSVEAIEKIATEHGTNWFVVVGAPLSNASVAESVVREAARQIGPEATLPEVFTGRNILDFFVQVDDDLPAPETTSTDPPTGAET